MVQDSQTAVASDDAELQRAAWRALPRRLFIALTALDTLFVAAYLALIALGRHKNELFVLFNLDKEANLPSWYAGTQLFIVAIGYLVLGSRLIPVRRKTAILRPLWLLMGVGFTFLSADEVGAVHERMSRPLMRMKVFNFHYLDQWMVLYLLVAAVIIIVFGRLFLWFWREWRTEVMLFALGFGVLAGGAIAAEMVHISRNMEGMRLLLEVGVEEWLEMFGVTILILPAYRILAYAMGSEPGTDEAGSSEV